MIIFNQWRFNTTPLHSNPGSKHGWSYKSHRNDCGSPGHNTPRWEATITRIQPSQSAPKSWPWVCVGGICPGGSVLVGLSWWDLSTSATLGETEVMEEKEEHGVTQMHFSNVSVAQGSVIPSLGWRGSWAVQGGEVDKEDPKIHVGMNVEVCFVFQLLAKHKMTHTAMKVKYQTKGLVRRTDWLLGVLPAYSLHSFSDPPQAS